MGINHGVDLTEVFDERHSGSFGQCTPAQLSKSSVVPNPYGNRNYARPESLNALGTTASGIQASPPVADGTQANADDITHVHRGPRLAVPIGLADLMPRGTRDAS